MTVTVKRTGAGGPMEAVKFALSAVFLPMLAVVLTGTRSADGSAEYAALGTPKCDPPGKFRAAQKLDFGASKEKGAVLDTKGSSFILTNQLGDCTNWCCKLPPVNCSVAMLEIKPTGANCHLLTCYPSELCVFTYGAEYLSYDRTFFVPSEAYNSTATPTSTATPASTADSDAATRSTSEASVLNFVDQFAPASEHADPQHDSAIKPRKGVGPPPLPADEDAERTTKPHTDEPTVPTSTKRKIPVGSIFLYAAIILCLLAMFAFFGQKFLDCWERRHYTRADYLLDGMYEDRLDVKPSGPCH
ncbi:hypothetical protein BIW11_08555 [Tropilaelaps mercedesae]|uniref:MANSC domain-containing protein n=1 Tax=Tropilaelaps mercedesae TaxID=418985 RepID=A0A1V9XP32_9ACAR|nr:hypothetical protein BIW11_08555 [Tropilaelaps mercedesae]